MCINIVEFNLDQNQILELWHQVNGERYPINFELIWQNTLQDMDVLKEASFAAYRNDEPSGAVVVKRYVDTELSLKETAFISILLVKDLDAEVTHILLEYTKKVLKSLGIKKVQLFGEFNNYMTGVPIEDSEWIEMLKSEGFIGECIYCDLYRRYDQSNEKDHMILDAWLTEMGLKYRTVKRQELKELYEFLRENFSGRWDFELKRYMENGWTGREYVILYEEHERDLQAKDIIGFCRVNDVDSPSIWYNMNFADKYENQGGVGPLGVSAKYRGQGLGKVVTDMGIRTLLDRGVTEIVIDWTDLEKFYMKMGYEIVEQFSKMTIYL